VRRQDGQQEEQERGGGDEDDGDVFVAAVVTGPGGCVCVCGLVALAWIDVERTRRSNDHHNAAN
jgi:hypothetical protein